MNKTMTLAQLAAKVDAELRGDPNCIVDSIATLQSAKQGQISFLDNPKYRQYLKDTKASAVILTKDDAAFCPSNALIVQDPYYAYSLIAIEFENTHPVPNGIHSTSVIGENCHIDDSVSIAANVVIGDNVVIGKNTQIDAGCVIGEGCLIGNNCLFWANVTLYHGVTIWDRVIIHSGAVIGSDGFGLANHEGSWHKIPQLGSVEIHNDVEVGANTTIDRGALNNTIIEDGVKLDNQIQIAHNVHIGAHTAIAACVGIAGSTSIGKHCMIGGAAGISGHLEIADHVVATAMAMITSTIRESGVYSSGTGYMPSREWQKNVVRFRQLDKVVKRLHELEKKLEKE